MGAPLLEDDLVPTCVVTEKLDEDCSSGVNHPLRDSMLLPSPPKKFSKSVERVPVDKVRLIARLVCSHILQTQSVVKIR